MPKKIRLVPPNAMPTRLAPPFMPSTMPTMRESMMPMKKVKARRSTTPRPLSLFFSIAHMKGGANLVGLAFGGTSLIFFGMAALGTMIKRDLSGMGKFLTIGALIVFAASLIMFIFPMPALMLALVVMVLAIFSLFILYDVNRIVKGGETNYISATLALYMNVYNVFQALLALVGIGGSRD